MKNIDKQLSYAPAEVHISYCGFASPAMQQMQDLFKKQITLLCYEKSKSVEELSEILQTDRVLIQDAVNSLTSLKMMKCENGKNSLLIGYLLILFFIVTSHLHTI